jgi:hypothetical protein
MHDLSLLDEFGSSTVIVVEPEGLGLEEGSGFYQDVKVEGSYAIANIAVINLLASETQRQRGA